MIDTKNISIDVEVAVKIDRLLDRGYCWTSREQVKQNMMFLLRLYDVKFSVKCVLERYVFRLDETV